MEIVQANTQAMLIINSNDEAKSLIPWTAFYQKVEYIESNWNQYIDTWINKNVVSLPIIEYRFYSNTSTADCWFLWYWSQWWYIFWRSSWQFRFTAWWTNWWKDSWLSYSSWVHTFRTDSSYAYVDSTRLSWNWWNMTIYNWNLYLFRAWWWFTVPNWSVRVYYCKISTTSWGVLREFYPCYRRSDNVIWLYDVANKVFYTNNWSWSFTKWNDI